MKVFYDNYFSMVKPLFIALGILLSVNVFPQERQWNGKKCAVVLTYDDALNVHLDNVVPALDAKGFKGTFYVMGSSDILSKRMSDWRNAASEGHELGNHTLTHPCDGNGRPFVNPETDLRLFTVERAVREIRVTNTLLKAIDGKDKRTFAYPCGNLKIGDSLFYPKVENEFPGARGVRAAMNTIHKVNLENIDCYMINNNNAEYMIDLVKKAIDSKSLLVFLFHGVGGEHNINVDLAEHNKLIDFLKENENMIWVAPMVEVTEYVKEYQKVKFISSNN